MAVVAAAWGEVRTGVPLCTTRIAASSRRGTRLCTPRACVKLRRARRSGGNILVGHATNSWECIGVAAEPLLRRIRARSRRPYRLPAHTNGVGSTFHPAIVSSNHAMLSQALCGCCPASARRTSMRCTDSAGALVSHPSAETVRAGAQSFTCRSSCDHPSVGQP